VDEYYRITTMNLMNYSTLLGGGMRRFSLFVALLFATLLVACGGGGGSAGTSSGSAPVVKALFSTAPASLTLASGSISTTYSISGGVAPYAVNADTPALLGVALSGANFSISTSPGQSGNGSVIIVDSLGAKVSISVTVPSVGPSVMFLDAPANLTMAIGGTGNTYTVLGGAKPYTAVSSNASVSTVTTPGADGKFTLQGVSAGTAVVSIKDAVGTTLTVSVTVASPTALFSTAPATLQILSGSSNFYTIFGGTAPYVVNSNNAIASAVVNGSSLVISGLKPGTKTVAISDAVGASITIDVTVNQGLFTDAPANVTVPSATGTSYAIYGGLPYPAPSLYRVNSSNPGVATATVTGSTLFVSALSSGATSLVITDSVGSTTTIAVTVPAAGAMLTTAPASLTSAIGSSNTYAISGGVGAYSVASSNPALVSAVVSPVGSSSLVISALPGTSGGVANVLVSDANGVQVTISVTVPAPLDVYTTAPSVLNVPSIGSNYSYAILGGFPAYSAVSSDSGVVSAGVSVDVSGKSTLTIGALAGGAASVVVTDTKGKTVTIQVRVGSSTTLFSDAPGGVISLPVGSTYAYLVRGGTAPYTVNSANPGVVSGSVVGPVLSVTGLASGSSVVRVTDSMGAFLDFSFTVGSGSSGSGSSTYPSMAPSLQTITGTVTSSIDATSYNLLKVTLKDPSGVAIPNQVISVAGDLTKLSFPDGTAALTDATGVATIKIARASLLATGAGAITITYDYKPGMIASYSGGVAPPTVANIVTTYVGYQVTTANITLTNLDVGTPASMAAYGTRPITVIANINGAPATATPVTIGFTATCGQVSPASASTDSTGKVLVTYSATDVTGTVPSTLGCSGKSVQITASTIGAAALSQNLGVTAAPATSMSFTSASPARIFLANSGGVTQSIVTFQLLNQLGEGIAGQQVRLTLKSLNGGAPKAAFDTLGSIAAVTLNTDSAGRVSQPVYSGSVPTNVLVNAALVSTPSIQTDSAVLAIASGRPVQSRLSLALESRAIEGFAADGTTTNVTMNLSDRQGNPVPDGTVVNFVTEGGVMIPPTCVTGTVAGNSSCSVTIRSQGTRPSNGLVTILAYAAGEEDFIDVNGNNTYDCGESFTDVGIAYRSDSMTSALINPYLVGNFTVPRTAEASSCGASVNPTPTSGDGVWGAADVRQQTVIVFATGAAVITQPVPMTRSNLTFTVADGNGNSMPSGSAIAVSAKANSVASTCSMAGGDSQTIPNSLLPLTTSASFVGCAAGDLVTVKVTSPLGTVTSVTYSVP
jgi:hypothetical protein